MFGGRLLADRREIDGMPGHLWASRVGRRAAQPARSAADAAHHGVRRLRRRHLRRARARRRSSARAAARTCRGSGCGASSPSARCSPPARPSAASCSAATTGPGVMMAAAMRTYVNRFAVGAGQHGRDLHQQRRWLAQRPPTWRSAGIRDRGHRSTAGGAIRCRMHLKRPSRVISGGEVIAAKGGMSLRSITVRTAGRRRDHRGRCACHVAVAGIPMSHLTCHHGGRPRWNERHRGLRAAGTPPKGMTVVGAANGTMTLGGRPRRRDRSRRGVPRRSWASRHRSDGSRRRPTTSRSR